MLNVHVKGGTAGGKRKVREPRAPEWVCPSCGKRLRYWTRCPVDGTARPE